MNRYVRRLQKYDIFCDNYMTEIKGANGTYKIKGYKILGHNLWVRYDGTVWPKGSMNDLIKSKKGKK